MEEFRKKAGQSKKEKAKREEKSTTEHWLQRQIVDAFRLIIGYFTTWWVIFRHPRITLCKFLSAESGASKGMQPGAFLIINVLVVLSIRGLLGGHLARFPFKPNWILNISSLVLPYLLGMMLFLFLVARLITKKGVRNHMLKILPVFCYASVVFLPFFLIRRLCSKVIEGVFINIMNMVSSILSGLPVKFFLGSYVRLLLPAVLLILIFLIWWLWLFFVGLEYVEPIQPRKKRFKNFTLACFYFLVLKGVAIFLLWLILHSSTLGAAKIIIFHDIERALSTQPPDYATAHVLSEKIANAKGMPVYFRFAAKLRSIVYQIALFAPVDSRKPIVDQALNAFSGHNYEKFENIISKYIKELLTNKRDPMRSFYAQLARNLEEANELYKSPFYVEKERQFFFMPLPPAPIALFP